MSGGVDSTVSAALFKKDYDVHGFFMDLGLPDSTIQLERAAALADKLAIPFQTIELSGPFQEKIVNYFIKSYARGKTPNPQILDLARSLDLPVLRTEYSLFVACGRLYMNGLRGLDGSW